MGEALAALMAALTAAPAGATAADDRYPGVIHRAEQVCLQDVDASGATVESCQERDTRGTPSAAREIADFRPITPPTTPPSASTDAMELALADAANASTAGYFVGGLAAGCLLNAIECAGATAVGVISDPTPPRAGSLGSHATRRSTGKCTRPRSGASEPALR